MIKRKGAFICMEGIDGVGKTTQRYLIEKWFKNAGFEVVVTREPGGTEMAENIREVILTPRDEYVSSKTEMLLFFAAREQHLQVCILPALERGAIVICDRFLDSTYAYQLAGGGEKPEDIDRLADYVVGENVPDMTFVLTVSHEVLRSRMAARGALDRMESKASDYYERAQNYYIHRASLSPDRYQVINAEQSIEQVNAQIIPKLIEISNYLRPTQPNE